MGPGSVLMLGRLLSSLEQCSLKMTFRHSVAHATSWIPALVGHCTLRHVHCYGDFSLSLLLSQSYFWISCGTALPLQPFFPQRLNLAADVAPFIISLASVKQFPSLLELFSGSCCLTRHLFSDKICLKAPSAGWVSCFVLPRRVRKPITSQQIYCSIIMLKWNNLWLTEKPVLLVKDIWLMGTMRYYLWQVLRVTTVICMFCSLQWEVSQNAAVYLAPTDMNCTSQLKRVPSDIWYKLQQRNQCKGPSRREQATSLPSEFSRW